jgi:hypothetical protein
VEYDNAFNFKGSKLDVSDNDFELVYCEFPMSSTCLFSFTSITAYDPYGLRYCVTVNAANLKLTLILKRLISPFLA